MTDHIPLTEEELAEMEEWAIEHGPPHVFRLIADLRASRAEVERLKGDVHYWMGQAGAESG